MLTDLIPAPPQTRGTFRLVPLLRERNRGDLRLTRRPQAGYSVVDLGKSAYVGYVPHSLVLDWTDDGAPVTALGAQLGGKGGSSSPAPKRCLHRMARREDGDRLRFLPLHLAMEGLLALHFGGPQMRWDYFSRRAISDGMSPREEWVVPGWAIAGFEDALRVFEIHDGQVGVLVFVADALACAFVTPHPDDYRALHHGLLEDFFGELIWQYAAWAQPLAPAWAGVDTATVRSLDDIRAVVAGMRAEHAAYAKTLATGLRDVPVTAQRVYQAGPFTLERFLGDLDPTRENHIGERILGPDGSLQYLKTYRMSAAQTRRAYLLKQLADADWHLATLAKTLQTTEPELLLRFEKAGFGWLFHQHVMDAARAARRRLLR